MEANQSLILVVDDNASVRDLLAARLERKGYGATTAVNGRDAISQMQQTSFDMVLLDIMMPEMNGYETLENLQNDPRLRHIPVIVLSALNDMSSVIKCIELGADDYLFKPINSSLLWARITASLEKKRLRDQEQARLAELAVLQQIDKELNANLDEQNVGRIILKWALRHTGGEAGFFGSLVDGQAMVQAAQNLNDVRGQNIPLADLGAVEAMANGRIQQQPLSPGEGLLEQAQYRILIPIHRQDVVGGLLVLESVNGCDEESLNFLTRLSDHAAIALNNAHLYAKAQAANRAKSDFVALVSHELKTPLSVVMSYGDLIQNPQIGPLNDKQAQFLRVIKDAASRMHSLVMELDDITRIETGKMKLEPESIAATTAVDAVVQLLAPQFAQKQQTLATDIPETLPNVWADHKRLLQILTNLINNANKYTPDGGNIQVSAALKTQDGKPFVQFAVQDDGLGIDKQDQSLIFAQFFRSGDSEVRARRGAGLGLNITKKIVELHGGQIWFESEFRQGTAFYFTLPVTETAVAVA